MNVKENLQYVYKLLSQIPVTGDSVERMATAKSVLREIFEEVKIDGRQQNPGTSSD